MMNGRKGKKMKLLIAGSRDFNNYFLLKEEVNKLKNKYNINTIISGKARGADVLGEQYAKEYNLNILEYDAKWDNYGKRAGMIRNEIMGDECDIAIVFWDGFSTGSLNMINYIKKLQKPLILINYNDIEKDKEW